MDSKSRARHIVFYQLLNDFSGSPKALISVIEDALAEGAHVDLYTSSGGPLDALQHPRLRRHVISYRFRGHSLSTLLRFATAQLSGFFTALKYAFKPDTSFYINTILPVGATLGGRLSGRPVTIHCHEYPAAKSGAYRLLARFTLPLAKKVICVSEHQAASLPAGLPIEVRPNKLPANFISRLTPDPEAAFERRNILMLASLKTYKGIGEFISLAAMMPQFRFTLVISAPGEDIDSWLKQHRLTPASNTTIYPCQTDVVPFYNDASIVVNLSDPELFIETSGLTVLEARAAQLPVIVPVKGGITEIIQPSVNGFHIDLHDFEQLTGTITRLLTDRAYYLKIARGK